MATGKGIRWYKWAVIAAATGLLFFIALVVVAKVYVEPVLRKRLDTIIVQGSDSLYRYKVGALNASLLGGTVEVSRLDIHIDSSRYDVLKKRNALPALVMQVNLQKASIKGINVFSLLLSKKIHINEIASSWANVRLVRFPKDKDTAKAIQNSEPLWRAIRPNIKDIRVGSVKLDGIKLLYKNEEGEEDFKLQFDRCDAFFHDIHIDSASLADTGRVGYVARFSLRLNDIKYRTTDSTYKMKAEWVKYNSASRVLEVDSFKLQPTLKKDERNDSLRKSWYTITFNKVLFHGLRLDRYLRVNRAEADSVVFDRPRLQVYQDKKALKTYKSKIGAYPHQKLLEAKSIINIKKFIARDMQIEVTEKDETTREEGTIRLDNLMVSVNNIVNDEVLIRQNPVTTAEAEGTIIGSPIKASFRFYLDSAEGRFDVKGRIGPVSAAQINPLATALANIAVPSAQIHSIDFFVRGEDFGATADVQMRYDNLSLVFRKRDEETGANTVRKFLTNWLNKFVLYPSNPNGVTERRAQGVKAARLTTQSFFGIIWKAVFAGMQQIMLKSGQVD